MTKVLNIGVLGGANIANRYIIPNILDLPENFNLVGVASRSYNRAKEFACRFNTNVFEGYDALLSAGPDAVYIPLPNSLHAEWIEKALNKNINVLVEKSLACSLQEVANLNALAKKNGLVLMENFQFRFHRQLKRILEIIECGLLGNLRAIRSSFGFPPFLDESNIRYKKDLGGGALLDAGAYPLKLAQVLLGDEIEVKAACLNYDYEKQVDIWGGGFIKQKKGNLFCEIAFGFDNYYQCNLEIWGSKAKLATNRIFTAPPGFEVEIIIESSEGIKFENMQPDNHFKKMLIYFYELVTGNISSENEYLQNIKQAELVHEFREIANGQ